MKAFLMVSLIALAGCVDSRQLPSLEVLDGRFETPAGVYAVERMVSGDASEITLKIRGESDRYWLSFRVVSEPNTVSLIPKDRQSTAPMAFNLPNCSYQRNDEEAQPLVCYPKISTMVDGSTYSAFAFELPIVLRQIDLGAAHRLPAEAADRLNAIRNERHHLRFEWQSGDGSYAVDALFRVGTDRVWFLDLPVPTGGLP